LAGGSDIATTEIVVMELLAGVSATGKRKRLRGTLLALPLLRLENLADFEAAADLYRACRRKGTTLRSLTDCLIASVAVRENVSVLHNDRDFEALARHSRLKLEPYVK
jgi:predicted nucleic acid-binding protein